MYLTGKLKEELIMPRGNQGWSTKPKDGSPGGRPPMTDEQKAARIIRRTQSYRATPQEHELVKWFLRYVRMDITKAAEMVGYPVDDLKNYPATY